MTASPPYCRDAGSGPGVVCLHASASTSGQWRGLIELLAPAYQVYAPDLYDAGNGPHWPSQRVIGLRDELALIEPLLAKAGSPLALVGHSYGAAVALIAALANPDRVRALVLYEPTLFALLDAALPASAATRDIRSTVADVSAALDAGDGDGAAARFVDYRRRNLEADARAAQSAYRRVGLQCAPLGACAVHGAHAACGIPLAHHAGAVHDGDAIAGLRTRRDPAAHGNTSSCRARRIRRPRSHGAGHRSGDRERRHRRIRRAAPGVLLRRTVP